MEEVGGGLRFTLTFDMQAQHSIPLKLRELMLVPLRLLGPPEQSLTDCWRLAL